LQKTTNNMIARIWEMVVGDGQAHYAAMSNTIGIGTHFRMMLFSNTKQNSPVEYSTVLSCGILNNTLLLKYSQYQ